MIFSKKIYKLGKGKNITLWANNSSNMQLYVFTKKVTKFNLITTPNSINISPTGEVFGYKSIIYLDNNFYCACYDENMSVKGNI